MIPQRIFFAENDMHLKTETMKTFFKNQMTCFIETFLVRVWQIFLYYARVCMIHTHALYNTFYFITGKYCRCL